MYVITHCVAADKVVILHPGLMFSHAGMFVLSVTLPFDLSSPPGSLVVCTGLSFYFKLCT